MRYFLFSIITINFIWLPLVQATPNCATQTDVPESECKALLSLFNSTSGNKWKDLFSGGWITISTPPCKLSGITCRDGHIVAIDKQNNGLSGPIPDLTDLTQLQELNLQNNKVNGTLPDLSTLTQLKVLNLSDNQLTGTIEPSKLPTSLQTLVLNNNPLTGTIPDLTVPPDLETVKPGNNQLIKEPEVDTNPNLTKPSNGSTKPLKNTGTPQFAKSHHNLYENVGTLKLTVKRTGGSDGRRVIMYATKSGSAKAGKAFEIAKGQLTWENGEKHAQDIIVNILDDTVADGNKTFIVTLRDTKSILDTVKVTILDNEIVAAPSLESVCPTDSTSINSVCRAKRKTLACNVTIEKGSSISGAVFECDAENKGRISNSTIKVGATVSGGILTGYIINEGTLADFDFRGASIKGGTLSGTIINNSKIGGWFQDVHLTPNTHINGGVLKGKITGDINAPALLENLEIKAGAKLSGVKIGDNVKIAEDVVRQ